MLVAFWLVINALVQCVRRMPRAKDMPEVLGRLCQTRSQHPNQG